MRLPRLKAPNRQSDYHVRTRFVGPKGWYPLQNPKMQQAYLRILKKYLSVYFCRLFTQSPLGNHTHLGVRVEPYRKLSRRHLQRLAVRLYPRRADRPKTSKEWRRLNHRLFDLSEFMRNVNGDLATWFNRRCQRRGALVAGRFDSTLLTDPRAVIDLMLYVDLNPVRAGLVKRPEDWSVGSANQRLSGSDGDLIPLWELMPNIPRSQCREMYRWMLYWRGAIPSREGQAAIPVAVLEEELRRGYESGAFLNQQPGFSSGGVLGPKHLVADWIDELRRREVYRRRRAPARLQSSPWFVVRPPRPRPHNRAETALGFG